MEGRKKGAAFRQNMKSKGYRALNIFVPDRVAYAITERCTTFKLTQGELLTCFADFLSSKAHRELFAPTAEENHIKRSLILKNPSASFESMADFNSEKVNSE